MPTESASPTAIPEPNAEGVVEFEGVTFRVGADGRWADEPPLPMSGWTEAQVEMHTYWLRWDERRAGFVLDGQLQTLVDDESARLLREAMKQSLVPKDADSAAFSDDPVMEKVDLLVRGSLDALRKTGIPKPLRPLAWAIWRRWEEMEAGMRGQPVPAPVRAVAERIADSETKVTTYLQLQDGLPQKATLRQALLRRQLIRQKGA